MNPRYKWDDVSAAGLWLAGMFLLLVLLAIIVGQLPPQQ